MAADWVLVRCLVCTYCVWAQVIATYFDTNHSVCVFAGVRQHARGTPHARGTIAPLACGRVRKSPSAHPSCSPCPRRHRTAPNPSGRTAMMGAAENGHSEVVGALLGWGVDIHAVDNEGQSALHLAAQHGHLEVCQRLIKAKASPEAENTLGRRPADFQDAEFWAAALA